MAYDGTLKFDTAIDKKGFEEGLKGINKSAKEALGATKKVILGASAATTALGTASVKTAGDFEASMSQVQATMGITKDSASNLNGESVNTMDALGALAKEMGASTAFSAGECADALNYLALAGYNTQEMADTLPTVLRLASAGNMDLATASDMVTDAMSALGIETKDADKMVDQMAKTASSSNTSVAQLGEAMLTIGGTAKTLKGGTVELSTALGILANNGKKGAEGGTALRNILLSLQAPTDKAAEAMEDIGLQVYDSEGKMRSLNDILSDLNSAMDSMTDQEKTDIINRIFNKTDLNSVNALLANTGDTWNELQSAIENSAGSAQDMADTQLDNLHGQLTLLKSAIEGLAISIGEIILPYVKQFVDKIQSLVDWLNNLDDETKKTIVKIGAVVAALGPAIIIIGKVMSLISTVKSIVTTIIPLLSKLFAVLMANPIALVAVAITALVAGFIYLWNTSEEFRNFWIGLWEQVKTFVLGAIESISNGVNSIIEWFNALPERIQEAITAFMEMLAGWGENIVSFFTETIPQIIDNIVEWFGELPEKIGYAIGYVIGTLIQWGIDVFDWIANDLPQIIENIVQWFATLPDRIWQWLTDTVSRMVEWGREAIRQAQETGRQFVENVVDFIRDLPSRVWEWLTETVSRVADFASDLWDKATEAGSEFVGTLVDVVSELPSQMYEIGSNIVEGVWNGICDMADWLWDNVTDFFGGLVDGAMDALGIHSPSRVMRDKVGKNTVLGVGEGMKDEMPALINTAKKDMQKLSNAMQSAVDEETASISVTKTGEQELARQSRGATVVSGELKASTPVVIQTEINMDGKQVAKQITPHVNEEMYKIDSRENGRGKGKR